MQGEIDSPKSNGASVPDGGEPVLFLGGPILPAAQQFAGILSALRESVEAFPKEYELHRQDVSPKAYDLDTEVEGIRYLADDRGWKRVHLVGYSAGGSIALAFAAAYPDRVGSLALVEPGEIGHGTLALESPEWGDWERTMSLPPEEGMKLFASQVLAPGAELPPPPPGMPPPWEMRPRASLIAFGKATLDYELEESRLKALTAPAYFALGDQSHPRFARLAGALRELLPDLQVEIYEGSHHLNPPYQADPKRFIAALRNLWSRGETP